MSERRLARYRLLRRIGAGGMAEVFLAELEGAEGVIRELVVKRIHAALAQDPDAVAMFVAEARIAARLNHPNIVQVYEFGRDGSDYFLAMELVDGCDLATLIRSWRGSAAPMGLTAWVMGELLEALAYLHDLRGEGDDRLGLVHRDVSPHNVLLGASGAVKLADFGIARAASRIDEGEAKIKGKLAFMAPEQARGELLDARADLFGAGAILYELLSGARPYRERAERALLDAVREGDVAPIREHAPWLSDELVEVVSRAIAPIREERFSDARSFHTALERAFEVDAVRAERGMLASSVRALQSDRGAASAERSERTVTAEDQVAVPEALEAALPPQRLAPVSRTRRLIERGAMAVAVFVVALLAERRTRPAPARPAPAAAAPTTIAVDPERASPLRALTLDLERSCATRITVVSGASPADADLRLTRWRDFAVGPLDHAAIGEALTSTSMARARETARALSVRLAASDDAPGSVRFVPIGFDPTVFFARVAAIRRLATLSDDSARAMREALVEAVGGAPRGARLPSSEVDGWGSWEIAMSSLALRHSGFGAYRVWVAGGATNAAAEVWSARAITSDPESASDLVASRGLSAVLGWDRVLQALDLLALGAELTDDDQLPPDRADVAFGWAPLSRLRHIDHSAWRLSRAPRGDDPRLDARGEPERLGAHVIPAELYGWTLRPEALARRAPRCVMDRLAEAQALEAVRAAAGWSGAGEAPRWARGAMDPALQEALTASRVVLHRDGRGTPASRRSAWWVLWRESVLGAAHPSRDDAAQRGAWQARARALFANPSE